MAEWHLPPDHIVVNWTDELLNLMIEKMVERKNKEVAQIEDARGGSDKPEQVSDAELLRRMKIEVKHGD